MLFCCLHKDKWTVVPVGTWGAILLVPVSSCAVLLTFPPEEKEVLEESEPLLMKGLVVQ